MRREINPEIKQERKNKIMEFLKSMIFPLVLFLIIAAGIFTIFTYQNKEKEEEIIPVHAFGGDTTPIVLENDKLKLTMDPTTTQFELLVKETDAVWFSNPADAKDDPTALSAEIGKLQSLVAMQYSNQAGLETLYDSYSFSVANGIYEITYDENSIQIDFSLGKVKKTFVVPPVITEEDWNKFVGQMAEKDATMVRDYFKKYDINNLGKNDDKEQLLKDYPVLENSVIYVFRKTTKEGTAKGIQDRFAAVGYTYEDYVHDKEQDLSESADEASVFNLSLILKLEDDELIAEMPFSSLEYPSDQPIYMVSILPYFGCGGKSDSGFLFVPEGGGSTIKFNNGRTVQPTYVSNVYGWNKCITRDSLVTDTLSYFPVYGISKGGNSFICIMEDGASYGAVRADISGKTNSYNYVNALYTVSDREKFDVGKIANTDVYKYAVPNPDEKIVLRYRFVNSPDYVNMAKNYREYMLENYGAYMTKSDSTSTPVTVEIIGAIDKVKQILGVPVSRPLGLTTFNEAEQMIETISNAGIDNLSVKLSGWCNGGVYQKVLNHVNLVSDLGNKKDFMSLTNKAQELGIDLYLNGVTMYAYDSNIFNGFNSFTDGAKLISKDRAKMHQYSRITYAEREGTTPYYLVHTDNAIEYTNTLVETAEKYGTGVSFEDKGMDLGADYYVKNTTTREASKNIDEAEFKRIADSGTKIMVNMGNDYAIPYADMITNMDYRGKEYTVLDDFVPFYQIALHGYVDYTGESINLCGNPEEEILASAEYGGGLAFTFMDENPFTLQKTLYTEYYGAEFDAWYDRMVEIYTRYNNELGHTFNQQIKDHKKLHDDIALTVYEDGTKVYVNYGFEEARVNGVTIGARDYKVVK